MKKLSFVNKLFYIVNSIAAVLLFIGYCLVYIPPKILPYVPILGLFVPFLMLLQVLFLLFWLLQLKKQILLPLAALALGWFLSTSPFAFADKNEVSDEDLTVMSYNVRLFNLYDWIDDKQIPSKIEQIITDTNPTIIALQEYVENDKVQLNFPYKFVKTKKEKNHFGMSIFSKFPIIYSGSLDLENTANNIIFADILYKKDTIRVYNIHLQSLQIKPDKENFGEENSSKLLVNVHQKFLKQAQQTEILMEHVQQWKGKLLIMGDFNNNAYSYVYKQISKNKQDAFLKAGKGFGNSFNYWFPVRIDFILTDKDAIITNFETKHVNLSDHFPIIATLNY